MLGQTQKSDRGFTLIELAIALVIIGIIAAIGSPNIIRFLSLNRVNEAENILVGAIKEAQRQAIRQGQSCSVNINLSTNTITGNPPNCLLNERTIEENINIRSNIPGTIPNIPFSYRGSTTRMGTIVLSSDETELQKCFVIALGTGITRTGIYTGDKTGSVSASNCSRI